MRPPYSQLIDKCDEIKNIFKNSDEVLLQILVIDNPTKANLEKASHKVQFCKNFLIEISDLLGKLELILLPSSELVGKRAEWEMRKNEIVEIHKHVQLVHDYDMDTINKHINTI